MLEVVAVLLKMYLIFVGSRLDLKPELKLARFGCLSQEIKVNL